MASGGRKPAAQTASAPKKPAAKPPAPKPAAGSGPARRTEAVAVKRAPEKPEEFLEEEDEPLAPEIPRRTFVRKRPGERNGGAAAGHRRTEVAQGPPAELRVLGISLPLVSQQPAGPGRGNRASAVVAADPVERVPVPDVRLEPPAPRLTDDPLTAPVAIPVAEPIAVDTAVAAEPPVTLETQGTARVAPAASPPEDGRKQAGRGVSPAAGSAPPSGGRGSRPDPGAGDGFNSRELELLRNIAAGGGAADTADRIDTELDELAGRIREAAPEARKAVPVKPAAPPGEVGTESVDRQGNTAPPSPSPAPFGRPGPSPLRMSPETTGTDMTPPRPPELPPVLPTTHVDPRLGRIDVQSDRQADFDEVNNRVIFTGKVELSSRTMQLRAKRVELQLGRNGTGMERVDASGEVVVRLQPDDAKQPTMASAGRVSYRPQTGELALFDWPKIQQGERSHIATGAETTMTLHTDGRMNTDGPNRTLIAH